MNDELMKSIIKNLVERADEAAGTGQGDFETGRRLAFIEVLSLIKGSIDTISPEAPNDFGLGFDIYDRFA